MALALRVSSTSLDAARDDALVLLAPKDGSIGRLLTAAGAPFPDAYATLSARGAFVGDEGQVRTLTAGPKHRFPVLVLAGAGPETKATAESVRKAVAAGLKAARDLGARRITLAFSPGRGVFAPEAVAEAAAEGAVLGLYRFEAHKTEKSKTDVTRLTVLVPASSRAAAARGLEVGRILGEAVAFSRDLGNEPSNVATPTYLAKQAQHMARAVGLKARIFEEADMRRLGMGSLLGVAKGSHEPAKLIMLTYEPSARRKKGGRGTDTVVLVGKGLTFDTGGISIKPAAKMEDMKFDMCGGAAVLGAMQAVARLEVGVRVVGLVPASENMPGGASYKPGDILKAMNGVTIEVKNTDAEGRLILADALAYASTKLDPKPKAIVDMATLTGACVVALGDQCAGLVSNDDALARRIEEAAEAAGDPVWRLPLKQGYKDQIKSTYADLSNLGGAGAGALTAAAFLERFVGDVPWAHLDIAGTAWSDKDVPLTRVGATGFGVRAMARMCLAWGS